MTHENSQLDMDRLQIRTYDPADQPHVRRLYEEGRLAGQGLPNDTAADIENIREAYLADARMHFWVADYVGKLVGMVGVACEENNMAEIRRLRVDPAYQASGVAQRLVEMAIQFCRHHAYLKVIFDTHMEAGHETVQIFDRFAFQHNRTRSVGGKELLEFYLDLYHDPKKKT